MNNASYIESPQPAPVLNIIFNILKTNITDTIERSHDIECIADMISTMPEKGNSKEVEIRKQPVSVVEHFYEELERLQSANSRLRETITHLRSVVGRVEN